MPNTYWRKQRLIKRLASQYMDGLWTEAEYYQQRDAILDGSLVDVPKWKWDTY